MMTLPARKKRAHQELHQIGEPEFQSKYQRDLPRLSANFWKSSQHRQKWESSHE